MAISSRHLQKVAFLILAALGGVAVGLGVRELALEQSREDAAVLRNRLLSEIDTKGTVPKVGDTLPDHYFESLSGDTIRLGDLVKGASLLLVIAPSCDECIEEIIGVDRLAQSQYQASRFIFVSSANPRILSDVRNKFGSHLTFLYDHLAVWRQRHHIDLIPFGLKIDTKLVVTEVIAGQLGDERIKRFIEQSE